MKKKISISAREIAERFGGEISGNPDVTVSAPARIESGRAGTICFLANPKYDHYIYSCKADIILVNRDFQPREPVSATLIRVDDAYSAVAGLLAWFQQMQRSARGGNRFRARLLPDRHISCSARIGRGTRIYPMVHIGEGVKIGRDCILYPGVKIYPGCVIGDRCTLHANAVIGADGFGFAPDASGRYSKIPQTGNVVIGNDVEIGASTTVDRSTMGSTIIHDGVKIDNLCMIAHNVEIGEHTVIAAQSGIAGSTKVGAHCVIAGQVGIAGHLVIADHTTIAAQSGITGDVREEGRTLFGSPAFDHREYLRAYAIFRSAARKKK